MRFSKDYQPQTNGRHKKADKKVTMTASVKPSTKAYFQEHRGESGKALDDYVESKNNSMEKIILLEEIKKEHDKGTPLSRVLVSINKSCPQAVDAVVDIIRNDRVTFYKWKIK